LFLGLLRQWVFNFSFLGLFFNRILLLDRFMDRLWLFSFFFNRDFLGSLLLILLLSLRLRLNFLLRGFLLINQFLYLILHDIRLNNLIYQI